MFETNEIKVFVAGGTGFIGSHMISALLQSGYSVCALRRQGSTGMPAADRSPFLFKWIDPDSIEQQILNFKPDFVINLATDYGATNNICSLIDANISLPLKILTAADKAGCQAFLQADTFFSKEAFDYKHMESYIRSKRDFLWWARKITDSGGSLKLINMRLEHVYGPGDGERKFVSQLYKKLRLGADVELTKGDQCRDFIYVTDVIEAFLCVIRQIEKVSGKFAEFGVGTGRATPLKEFVEMAWSALDSRSKLYFDAIPQRAGEIMYSVADPEMLKSLGWNPETTLSDGVRKTAGLI